jgi:hypothetical protein
MKNSAPLSLFLSLFNNAFSAAQIKRTEWEGNINNESNQMEGKGKK